MTRQIDLRSPTVNRRQPLLTRKTSEKSRIGEVAGGTAAECAAVCCCCPCGLMNLLILAVYKVPAGLCRRAWKKKKRQRAAKKKGVLLQQEKEQREQRERSGPTLCCDESEVDVRGPCVVEKTKKEEEEEEEDEMWGRFYGTGFWRSPSQREV